MSLLVGMFCDGMRMLRRINESKLLKRIHENKGNGKRKAE